MRVFAQDSSQFVDELDTAIEAHLGWTRRVLRCAVLRTSPGEDVLAVDADCRCQFGRWFDSHREAFEQLDAVATARVFRQHKCMHDAVRTLCGDLLAGRPCNAGDLDVFEATQTSLVADLARLKTQFLDHSARHDPLTGLLLRYGLEEEFARYRALAQRSEQSLFLILVDVDHFKQVNDEHGHAVGDRALRHVATLLRAEARTGEPLFRVGGEEFLVMLHARDETAAAQAADRLLQALRDSPLHLPGGAALSLRVSAGLAVVGPEETMAAALQRADLAMYAAKQAGRDQWKFGHAPP